MQFKPAVRERTFGRLAFCGPQGSGKSYTSFRAAIGLLDGSIVRDDGSNRIAVIDSENRSFLKYEGYETDGVKWKFDYLELQDYSPSSYAEAIGVSQKAGHDLLIIDSLSHAWSGAGGALELKDKYASKGGDNNFTAWRHVTPLHNQLVESMLRFQGHLIVTMRTKVEYLIEERGGKKVPVKIGLSPVQRSGMEYEFDIVCDMDEQHILTISKTRCPAIDGKSIQKPGAIFADPIREWLETGVQAEPKPLHSEFFDKPPSREQRRQEAATDSRSLLEKAAAAAAQANGNGHQEGAPETADAPAVESKPAARESTPSEPAKEAVASSPPDEPDGTITSEQKSELIELIERLGVGYDDQVAICQKRGHGSFRAFSSTEAEELIGKLQEMDAGDNVLPAKEKSEVADGVPAKN